MDQIDRGKMSGFATAPCDVPMPMPWPQGTPSPSGPPEDSHGGGGRRPCAWWGSAVGEGRNHTQWSSWSPADIVVHPDGRRTAASTIQPHSDSGVKMNPLAPIGSHEPRKNVGNQSTPFLQTGGIVRQLRCGTTVHVFTDRNSRRPPRGVGSCGEAKKRVLRVSVGFGVTPSNSAHNPSFCAKIWALRTPCVIASRTCTPIQSMHGTRRVRRGLGVRFDRGSGAPGGGAPTATAAKGAGGGGMIIIVAKEGGGRKA